jgi:two-component system, OmpR family, sensor histidine kinase TctE
MHTSAVIGTGLRRRLLLLLLGPLILLAGVNTWFDYRQAGDAALQQDRQLLGLVPLLADSVIARGPAAADAPVLLMAPPVEDFLKQRPGVAAFGIANLEGQILIGETWLGRALPSTWEPEFSSEVEDGVTYRIVTQRVRTVAGDLVMYLADGSDTRQQWLRLVFLKVMLPNLVLAVVAVFAIDWAVRRALRPLIELKEAVERRSPRDLSALDTMASPEEVRPLVSSINRLLELVNAQAESQRRFVADAAHQLRTPLAGLQAQVEAWAQAANTTSQDRKNTPDIEPNKPLAHVEYAQSAISLGVNEVGQLRDAVRRTSQLANQLLALSRADALALDTQPMQRLDLKDVCESLLEVHLNTATAKHIDLGLDVSSVHVMGHEWLLREMVGNLLDNAVKYTPEGGTVTLRCGRMAAVASEGTLRPFIQVEDDGPGVPPDERVRVLERFYRVAGVAGQGNGLGLAIAQEIAHVHGSALNVGVGPGGRGLRVTMVFLP